MKLASLKDPKSRDGHPVLVKKDNSVALSLKDVVPSVREAVENWKDVLPLLQKKQTQMDAGGGTFQVDWSQFHSPLPRAFQWADGSAFIHHIKLVRKARGAPLPETLLSVPLMYQGGSDAFLAPTEDIPMVDFSHGVDFESEVAVVTSDVPMGTSADAALKHILLVLIVNDVTLRGLVVDELAQGFGFFQSKPSSAFGPLALTPDELGPHWKNGRVHLPLHTEYNGQFFGRPDAGEMHFHFGQLIAHAARTRDLRAGTIIGSGTVSNDHPGVGSSCLVEKRMIEKIGTGEFKTPFMKAGDTVKIEMRDPEGRNLFGTIQQRVRQI
ncbi:MAG: fumarylacetoacetate hydrolase family protein [Bdellovibrionales bacterium]|nr:fumarylacetoacetate hydrolase family protein [Bdellovibrionales bacterium]